MPRPKLWVIRAALLSLVTPFAGVQVSCRYPEEPVDEAEVTRSLEVLSPVYTLDRPFRSMKGPSSVQPVSFPQSEEVELLWVTGFRSTMVGPDGETPQLQEFMCHSNLDFDQVSHSQLFNLPHLYSCQRDNCQGNPPQPVLQPLDPGRLDCHHSPVSAASRQEHHTRIQSS